MTELETIRRPQAFEPCEECGAAMDPQQRYCINCAARRGNGANPSSRYFAAMSKRARRPLVQPAAAKRSDTSRAAAVGFFALLPIAVALGVMVGRSGSGNGDNEALLQALRERQATAAKTAVSPTAGATAAAASKASKKAAQAGKSKAKPEEKVVAHTENGDLHSVTHFKASEEKEQEDTRLVEENPEQTGENYIKAQQNLPDVVVVGGEGGSAPAPPAGVEP
jgi:hypothetical protein